MVLSPVGDETPLSHSLNLPAYQPRPGKTGRRIKVKLIIEIRTV